MFKFLEWISKSFGSTGEVSGRRLTAFAVTCMYLFSRCYYVLHQTDVYYQFLGFVVDALFVLLLFGIVTMQQITELKNGTVIQESKTTKETTSETKIETTQ